MATGFLPMPSGILWITINLGAKPAPYLFVGGGNPLGELTN